MVGMRVVEKQRKTKSCAKKKKNERANNRWKIEISFGFGLYKS
jgi:hypothetical protein